MITYVLKFHKDNKDMFYTIDDLDCIKYAVYDVLKQGLSFEVDCLYDFDLKECF